MDNQARIIIRRSSEWLNRLRGFRVMIDGQEAGRISNGATEEFKVAPGAHKIFCKIDWCSSRGYEVNLQAGETSYLFVRSGMKYYWQAAIPVIIMLALNLCYSLQDIRKPEWLLFGMIGLGLPVAGYFLYYTVFSRKDYLQLAADQKSGFSS